jgi:outer membrane protein TolC
MRRNERTMKKKITASLFLMFGLISAGSSGVISAAEPHTVTWEECISSAEMNNPDIVSARELILQSEAATGVTRSGMLPQVSASASGQNNWAKSAGRSTESKSFTYGIEAKQLIFDGFKSWYDYKSAITHESVSKFNYMITSATVRLNIRTAYVNLLKAQKLVPLAKAIETRRKHIMDVVKLHYDSGTEHRGSYFSAKADYASAQADTLSAERNLLSAQKKLATLIGVDENTTLLVSGELELPEKYGSRPDISTLAVNTPSVKKAAAAKEESVYSARAAMLDFSPTVSALAGAEKSGDVFPPADTSYYVGLSANLSLFSGGSTYYTMKKSESAVRQNTADEKSARDNSFRTLDAAWNSLCDSISNIDVQNQYLSAANERSKIGEVQYLTGSLTFNNWTILENNLVSAQKSYLEACAEALRSEATWIQSVGGTLENEKAK